MPPVIEALKLVKIYGPGLPPALDGVDLTIESGELFGLVGPNGAGKTTMISIFCGLSAPTAGRVHLFGLDLKKQIKGIKKLIGLVPQETALYPSLTARENLTYFGRMRGLSGSGLTKQVEELLEYFGLSPNADRRVAAFSGGMKRRANLCVGLLGNPSLLFLDEPTVGIDVQSRTAILERLEGLRREGLTIFLTSHYLEEVERLCQKMAILDKGRILWTGNKEDLRTSHPGFEGLEEVFLELTGRALRD